MRSSKELSRNIKINYKVHQNEIKSVVALLGIEQLVKQPTRFDINHIINITSVDIIGTNNASHIPSSRLIPLS